MTKTDFLVEIANILEESDPGVLTGKERLAELPAWDSLAVLSFMALARERFHIALSPKDILGCTTVEDLFEITVSSAKV